MDVNDAFDNIFLAEEKAVQSGYEEGFNAGKNRLLEGFHLGYHRASKLGAQLGYYSGTLLPFKNHSSEKISAAAEELLREINEFPKINDENTDINEAFDKIKSKFQKFSNLAKIRSSYPEADKLEF